jgi:hypothetical protein
MSTEKAIEMMKLTKRQIGSDDVRGGSWNVGMFESWEIG